MDCLAEPVPSLKCAGVSIVPSKYVNTCALFMTVVDLFLLLDPAHIKMAFFHY